jgi:DNA-binding transcriptional regulator GbsR (MarR family)
MKNDKIANLKKELSQVLSGDIQLLERVMETLDKEKIIHYQSGDEISLFSTAGRILYTLILDPEMTQRALAVYLGLSETMIEKTLKTLIEQGLITKTKVNRKNVYTFDINLLINNPDIQRLPGVVKQLGSMCLASPQVDEEAPF